MTTLKFLSDDSEHSRLDKQHFVHLLSNDGLVVQGAVASVRGILDPNNPTPDGSPKRILDLGETQNRDRPPSY